MKIFTCQAAVYSVTDIFYDYRTDECRVSMQNTKKILEDPLPRSSRFNPQ